MKLKRTPTNRRRTRRVDRKLGNALSIYSSPTDKFPSARDGAGRSGRRRRARRRQRLAQALRAYVLKPVSPSK